MAGPTPPSKLFANINNGDWRKNKVGNLIFMCEWHWWVMKA